MAPSPATPSKTTQGRRRGRPRGSTTSSRGKREALAPPASEPLPKKRRYIPGGPGGGGRYIEEDTKNLSDTKYSVTRSLRSPPVQTTTTPSIPKRERSTRARTATNRDEDDDGHMTSAAAVAAVVENEGYKPREERGWEEFHPHLDIEATLKILHAEDVDGIARAPKTPIVPTTSNPQIEGDPSPSKEPSSNPPDTPSVLSNPQLVSSLGITPGTPSRRRGRPPRYNDSLLAVRPDLHIPKVPKPLPIHGQNGKEKLDLKQPSFRKTDRILLFESKKFGQARYVDKSMSNVGYQESDHYIRPERKLIKTNDLNAEEDTDIAAAVRASDAAFAIKVDPLGRVEYDMDEQDDMWLESLNTQRKTAGMGEITREIFEITITKIEKEWHALEKRIPKPNPKPPQTHRPRSSSAAAVNGEPQAGEEVDSKCAICDDGDCENTNAIVFCDGCDLAVHQECYGVPFIPEGQWLCRKCQLIGRGIPTCIFCPNTDGAFKQTNSSKWAHLLCAMWIPEVSLGNHTFMEPVMEVEKVPKNRWRLSCYICQQKMGACIQCGNKACYQAFHVTCARRARLYLKMKNSQGLLAPIDGNMVLKALCDKHCPSEYAKENNVAAATKAAQRFYKKAMKGRIWATSQASARELAATYKNAMTEHPPDESQMTGAKLHGMMADKRKGQSGKSIWKLPSGAPVIPHAVFMTVDSALQRFSIHKRREFVADACRYWTLKREARRGAALLKRLQLQMETFSSMELTRRNFAAMGSVGKERLDKRIEFARALLADLQHLQSMSENVVSREAALLEEAETLQEVVDTMYFPVYKIIAPALEKAFLYDKNVFKEGLLQLQAKIDERFYTTALPFARDLCDVINVGINTELKVDEPDMKLDLMDINIAKKYSFTDKRERRRLGKRILKTVQPQLEVALRAECEVNQKLLDPLKVELNDIIEKSLEFRDIQAQTQQGGQIVLAANETEKNQDINMVDAPPIDSDEPTAEAQLNGEAAASIEDTRVTDIMDVDSSTNEASLNGERNDPSPTNTFPPQFDHAPSVLLNEAPSDAEPSAATTSSLLPNGAKTTSLSPPINGILPAVTVHPPSQTDTPPTPPQSNGSLGREPADPLTEGGVAWYLKGRFKLAGAEASEALWAGRDAVRSLSEELTDIDDEEFRGLEETVLETSSTSSKMPISTSNTVKAHTTHMDNPGVVGRIQLGKPDRVVDEPDKASPTGMNSQSVDDTVDTGVAITDFAVTEHKKTEFNGKNIAENDTEFSAQDKPASITNKNDEGEKAMASQELTMDLVKTKGQQLENSKHDLSPIRRPRSSKDIILQTSYKSGQQEQEATEATLPDISALPAPPATRSSVRKEREREKERLEKQKELVIATRKSMRNATKESSGSSKEPALANLTSARKGTRSSARRR